MITPSDQPVPRHSRSTDERQTCEVRRVTWVGLGVNTFLSVLKLVCGVLGNSQAVVADGVHSLSDGSTDVAILIGVRYWARPADADHPHGHRRIETVVTMGVGLILAAAATAMAFRALSTMQEQHAVPPGWLALGAALLSLAVKEVLYRWTFVAGKRLRSSAVMANAWHHRSDAFSSIPAVLAVAGARLSPSSYFLDHVGTVVVSVFILGAAVRIIWPALRQLADVGASDRELKLVKGIALRTPGVQAVHAIRTRQLGSAIEVDLHVLVNGQMTVYQGHAVSENVKRRLIEHGPGIVDVVVHVEPSVPPGDSGRVS